MQTSCLRHGVAKMAATAKCGGHFHFQVVVTARTHGHSSSGRWVHRTPFRGDSWIEVAGLRRRKPLGKDKVPVVTPLRIILNEHRKSVPNAPNAFIFAGERKGAPLNLANLVRREMTTVVTKGKWHGWHGFRRGLATRGTSPSRSDSRDIAAHGYPKVTQDSYIVIKSNATTKAMQKVDAGWLLKAWRKSSR